MTTITRMYRNRETAENAVRELERLGVSTSDISLSGNGSATDKYQHLADARRTLTGAGVGVIVAGAQAELASVPQEQERTGNWQSSTANSGVGVIVAGSAARISDAAGKNPQSFSEDTIDTGTLLAVRTDDALIDQINAILEKHQWHFRWCQALPVKR